MGKTTEGLAREGPPPQKPPIKTQFDFHTRHLLHTLSQHLPGTDPATTDYSYATLSDENARLVRRTIGRAQRALERRQERKKKSKSTGAAADALEFYRHATVKARKMKGLDVEEEEDLEEHELLMSDSDSEEEEEEESSSEEEEEEEEEISEEESSEDEEDGEKKKKATTPTGSDGSDDEESAASITSEEFLSAHNDLCEVCSGVGDDDAPLLCCATCTLVFHQRCHRPVLVKEPPDNWSCAYCDDTGVTLHKRDSRERKRASKGVREMTKMMEDQAEREQAEAKAARAARRAAAAAGGGGDGSPSKSSAKTPPKPVHNIRDPETGRFMTMEKRIALYGPLGVPPKEVLEGQAGADAEGGESGGRKNDLSDLTPEEIARLASGGGSDDGERKEDAANAAVRAKNEEDKEGKESPAVVTSGGTDSTKLKADAKQDVGSGMTTPTQSGQTTPKKEEVDDFATGGDDEQYQAQKSKQQLKGAELKLLLGAMSPEEVDISGPRARRQRKAPSLYDPGDMAGDMHWSSKKEAEGRPGQRASVPPGSKKRKRELLSDVLERNKKSKSSASASGEKSPKKPRTIKGGKKKKAKTSAKQKKKKVCCDLVMEFSG